ncbi:MAG TPA: hypothetical protein PK833_15220, partial [Vicingus sp.]|nr:hypothetical protein [Vicingus sp.]
MEKSIIKKGSKEFIMFVILFAMMFAATKMFAQHQIGHTQITFTDPARGNRAIQTEIYYPAN